MTAFYPYHCFAKIARFPIAKMQVKKNRPEGRFLYCYKPGPVLTLMLI
jgi:hypothetical protein